MNRLKGKTVDAINKLMLIKVTRKQEKDTKMGR